MASHVTAARAHPDHEQQEKEPKRMKTFPSVPPYRLGTEKLLSREIQSSATLLVAGSQRIKHLTAFKNCQTPNDAVLSIILEMSGECSNAATATKSTACVQRQRDLRARAWTWIQGTWQFCYSPTGEPGTDYLNCLKSMHSIPNLWDLYWWCI